MDTAMLTLDTLGRFSEELAENFGQQLETAVADCRQRPGQTDKRTVTVKLLITPHPEDPDDVQIEPVVVLSIPARKIEPQRARRTQRNQLQFDFSGEE